MVRRSFICGVPSYNPIARMFGKAVKFRHCPATVSAIANRIVGLTATFLPVLPAALRKSH